MNRLAEALPAREQDGPELEALFDSIAAAQRAQESVPAAADNVISQIGQLTRKLHDALRELGYDTALKDAARAIPDARERLSYVATKTEQAAERALNAIEQARPIQDRLGLEAQTLARDWERVFNRELEVPAFKALAERTYGYLADVPARTQATNAQLMDIMMAQDFQDLTGQVIKKVTDMAHEVERQLLNLLLENCAPERRQAAQSSGLLNGPVTDAAGRGDVVTSQAQVDDLLASLGF